MITSNQHKTIQNTSHNYNIKQNKIISSKTKIKKLKNNSKKNLIEISTSIPRTMYLISIMMTITEKN
jgi:hypothetical protein